MVKVKVPWRVTPRNRKQFPPLTPTELAVYLQPQALLHHANQTHYASRVCVSEVDGLMYSDGNEWRLTQKGRALVLAYVVVA